MFRKNASTAADKVRVLIVDDSELYRTIVRHLLARIPNIEVVDVACDGAEALEKIEQHAPDLITLDVEMPVLDGLGVLDEMRRRRMKSSVLMLSSVTLEGAGATLQSLQCGPACARISFNGTNSEMKSFHALSASRCTRSTNETFPRTHYVLTLGSRRVAIA